MEFQVPVRDRYASLKQSIIDELAFSILDFRWIETVFERLLASKAKVPYRAGIDNVLDLKLPSKSAVAIIGDWGTGTKPAIDLIKQVALHEPDLLIHLGDVYYSGTSLEYQERFFNPLDLYLPDVPVLALCGNHDVYAGGSAYYAAVDRLFQGASYFCVRNQDWQFVAMDTGRDAFDDNLDPNYAPQLAQAEADWVMAKMFEPSFKGRTILLSHHQPFSAYQKVGTRDSNDRMLAQLGTGIRGAAAWLSGHEHKTAVYGPYKGIARHRCVGGSAVPEFVVQDVYKPMFPDVPVVPVKVGDDGIEYNKTYAVLGLDGPDCKASYFEVASGVSKVLFEEDF
jgi:3',5'-cyclic AMP phosphodiesterase CpdA